MEHPNDVERLLIGHWGAILKQQKYIGIETQATLHLHSNHTPQAIPK